MRGRIAFATGAGAALLLAMSCRTPTQMTIRVQTIAPLKCSELGHVTIIAGPNPNVVEDRAATGYTSTDSISCQNDQLVGTLVITPDGDTGAVLVSASLDPSKQCLPPKYEGCIVARRSFSFIMHVRAEIPISLTLDCRDYPCAAVTSCRKADCVPSNVDCNDDGTCTAQSEPTDSSPQGDASIDVRIPDDAHPPLDGAVPDANVPDGTTGDSGLYYADPGEPRETNYCPQSTQHQMLNDKYCCGANGQWTIADLCASEPVKLHCTGGAPCDDNTDYCVLTQAGATFTAECENQPAATYILCETTKDCPSGRICSSSGPTINGALFHMCGPP